MQIRYALCMQSQSCTTVTVTFCITACVGLSARQRGYKQRQLRTGTLSFSYIPLCWCNVMSVVCRLRLLYNLQRNTNVHLYYNFKSKTTNLFITSHYKKRNHFPKVLIVYCTIYLLYCLLLRNIEKIVLKTILASFIIVEYYLSLIPVQIVLLCR